MNERLVKLMIHYGLSPSEFADSLGVIRSTISHIMSGRNKPGVDLLQKALDRYRNINPYWLLLGEGNMLLEGEGRSNDEFGELTDVKSAKSNEKINLSTDDVIESSEKKNLGEDQRSDLFAPGTDQTVELHAKRSDGAIKRITVYFSDNTFQDFRPD